MKRAQKAAPLGDHQASGGFPVKPMRQFQVGCLWTLCPQCLDNAETQATATMNRNTGWFVDNQATLVLEQNMLFQV